MEETDCSVSKSYVDGSAPGSSWSHQHELLKGSTAYNTYYLSKVSIASWTDQASVRSVPFILTLMAKHPFAA